MCPVAWRHSMVFLTSHVRHQSSGSWAKSDLQSLHLATAEGTDKIQLVCLPSRLHSIKSVVETSGEVSGGILKEEASTCTASQGARVTAHHSTSLNGCITVAVATDIAEISSSPRKPLLPCFHGKRVCFQQRNSYLRTRYLCKTHRKARLRSQLCGVLAATSLLLVLSAQPYSQSCNAGESREFTYGRRGRLDAG